MQETKSLEEKTLQYWRVAIAWEGRAGKSVMTAGQALDITKTLALTTNPKRRLIRQVLALEAELIQGHSRNRKKFSSQPAKLTGRRPEYVIQDEVDTIDKDAFSRL